MARYLLDTNILVYVVNKDDDSLCKDVQSILMDYENEFLISIETVRELIVAYRTKKLLARLFRSPIEMVESLQRDYGIRIVQTDMEVMRTMAKLEINESEKHNDPSDHVIIAQAITMRLPLISSDHKFPFYRNQGLDLIYNA
jgi:PIN domain nuclease of toxin-antitoxin system